MVGPVEWGGTQDGSASQGGDLGWISPGEMPAEVDEATAGHKPGTPEFAHRLFALACRLPGNVKATPEQWEQIRHAIGPAQWSRIDKTLGTVMSHDTAQAVDAVFSDRS